MNIERRKFIALAAAGIGSVASGRVHAEENPLTEPVHRVASATAKSAASTSTGMARALEIARDGLQNCQQNINDYTAVLIKRERVNGVLGQYEYMFAKIRNRKTVQGKITQPLGVYLGFLKPSSVKGREVIYVEGKNNGNLVAHEGGLKGRFLPSVNIPPTGMLAMRGQRYPMTEIGIENLMAKLIQRGEAARRYPDVSVEFRRNAKIKDRVCTVLQVTQPTKRPELEFYQAHIFIDDQLNVPVRYVAYDWPKHPGAPLEVIEEYTYLNLKLNPGLTDSDFDPYNKAYNFYS